MTANSTEQQPSRAAAVRHVVDVLRWCVTGRWRSSVLGYAASGQSRARQYTARWRALAGALAGLWRPEGAPVDVEWVLGREAGGWALRRLQQAGPPAFFTTDVPADDQNAAFDWASRITPDVEHRAIHYVGPPPS
ncbi:hypothetical protein ABZ912_42430 [Nonomuraea angiospora]|uniref:hypothetical protein n=1 Tax=Nonomuraea angiospora TaxID=46172 RepID=UPI0033F2ABA6